MYFKDPWNNLDFFIVLISYVSVIAKGSNVDTGRLTTMAVLTMAVAMLLWPYLLWLWSCYYGRTYYGCGHVTMGVLTGYYGCTFFSCSHCGRTYHGRSLVVLTIPTTLWPCRAYQAPSSRYGSSEYYGRCAQSSGSRACASWSCRYSSRCPCCLTSWCHYKYK